MLLQSLFDIHRLRMILYILTVMKKLLKLLLIHR